MCLSFDTSPFFLRLLLILVIDSAFSAHFCTVFGSRRFATENVLER